MSGEVTKYDVFDVSRKLRERGWLVPAYTMPPKREDLAVLRVVVRNGFSHDMAELFLRTCARRSTGSTTCPARCRARSSPAPSTTDVRSPAALDPVAAIRSKPYLSALVLAAILGIPISAVAYGFLALVTQDPAATCSPTCPTTSSPAATPAWWPVPWLVLCGLLTGLTIRYLPGNGGPLARARLPRPAAARPSTGSCPASSWPPWPR